jgi:hypothetical protein
MRETSRTAKSAPEACLDLMDFSHGWNEWRGSLKETVDAAREIDPSDRHVIGVVEDMIDFLSDRVCPGSSEERFVSELWDRADEDQRHVLAHIFLKMLDERASTSVP